MPMSSSGAFCYTLCQTASIVSATMASSPMAPAPTASLSVSGCSMAVTLVPASLPTIAAKAIAHSPQPTSQSVPIAAAPCGRSQPCRAPATLSHSPVTRHDCPADVYDHHARPPRCVHRYPLPINLSHREYQPFQLWRLTQSWCTALEHRQCARTNRLPLAAAKPAPTSTVSEPLPLSP